MGALWLSGAGMGGSGIGAGMGGGDPGIGGSTASPVVESSRSSGGPLSAGIGGSP